MQEKSPVLERVQYRDLRLSGSAYSQVRIMAIAGALGCANLGGRLRGSARWEAKVTSPFMKFLLEYYQ